MSSVWYTSDLHIGHRLVAGLRGFYDEDNVIDVPPTPENPPGAEAQPDTDAYDAWLADIWDSMIGPKDQVIIAGDISINGGQHALDWIAERPGIKHLVAGNHDPVGPWDRRAPRLMKHWMQYFDSIQPYLRRRLNGHSFLVSHFPYTSWGEGPERGGEEAARYVQYRLPDLGMPLLHGHTHGTEREHGNMLHVGVDAWEGRPVPQEYVMEWLSREKEKAA